MFQLNFTASNKTLNIILATYEGDKSPWRLVVQELKAVAFQVQDGPNEDEQQGQS